MKDISKQEFIEMMNRCKHEILDLRRTISVLRPKAEAYDMVLKILNLLPRSGEGMSEDVVWILDKRIRDMQSNPASTESNG
jgi:hypothetical protein